MSRRSFAGIAAAVAAPVFIPRSAFGANDHINGAVIGNGNRGTDVLDGMLKDAGVRVIAVCDVDRSRRENTASKVHNKYGGEVKCDAYADYRELLDRKDIDAVGIATPDHWHALMACAAMKAGKDVYCEKPLTLTIAEGRAMAETARRYGRILQTGVQRRSNGAFRRICELAINGRVGPLKTIEIGLGCRPVEPHPWTPEPVPEGFDYDMWLGPAPSEPYHKDRCHYNFRFVRAYSGGEMTNIGQHFLDLAQWALGADAAGPVEIAAQGEYHDTGLWDTFHKFRVEYKYACGATVVCTHGPVGIKFIGTEGWLAAPSWTNTPNQGEPASVLKSVIRPNEIHLHESHGDHIEDFMWAVRTRGRPSAPVEVGHRTVTVCHLGNIALTTGRTLRWDAAKEEFVGDAMANAMRSRPYRAPWRL
jgi:predicted dehydrogenase